MKLKRDTWILLGVLALTAAFIGYKLVEAERLRKDAPASSTPPPPYGVLGKDEWEARKRLQPIFDEIENHPGFNRHSNASQPPEQQAVPLTDAELKEIKERYYANELKRGPSPISEPPQEK
ncbi:hypothetical protein [Hydrogenophaga sp.]|uniref:hypothetical protein n=1 Tax=Hydrogenophaga sp. TaxID=1904254 RepID=UPI0026268EE6|nr:hypothetical protein [Hydrogenophaga sp.]